MKTGAIASRYTGGAIRVATGYNDRSEVTSDATYLGWSATVVAGRNDAYTFDNLGNRVSTTHNVFSNTVPVAATSQYTRSTNGLNQYSERDVPAYYDVAGAAPGSVVTVSKSGGPTDTAARNGSYFFDAYNLPNSASAVFTGLTATDNSAPANSFAPVAFVAKTKEAFVYDFDGNLTRDGRWDYTYDAENRLISMQTLAALTPGVIPTAEARRLEFKYDYLGRRVQKTVRDGFSLLLTDEKFVYNGWLLIATLDANNSNALRSSYYWGLDLSGTTQGAGGVGGLLMTKENTNTYLTVSDHLGNIHGMVTASDITVGGTPYLAGTVVAEYEYDASGKTVRETGPCAGLFPFRSATKYTDLETGLVYYGQRYYSPSLGRFINQDPIAESGSVNLYGFCGNNGVNSYDMLGCDPRVTVVDAHHIRYLERVWYTSADADILAKIMNTPMGDHGFAGNSSMYGLASGVDDVRDYSGQGDIDQMLLSQANADFSARYKFMHHDNGGQSRSYTEGGRTYVVTNDISSVPVGATVLAHGSNYGSSSSTNSVVLSRGGSNAGLATLNISTGRTSAADSTRRTAALGSDVMSTDGRTSYPELEASRLGDPGRQTLLDRYDAIYTEMKGRGIPHGGEKTASCHYVNGAFIMGMLAPIPNGWSARLEHRGWGGIIGLLMPGRDHWAIVATSQRGDEMLFDYWGDRTAGENPNLWFRDRYSRPLNQEGEIVPSHVRPDGSVSPGVEPMDARLLLEYYWPRKK